MEKTHTPARAERFDPPSIEQKWQARWEADKLYHAEVDASQPKYYCLTMLPYPSGDLHVGHWYAMAPSDTNARYRRMQGYNVVFPIGFDAFGLPAENAAIKRKIHPYTWTYDNIPRMRQQLRSMGAMWDWEREVVTCDPEYYTWNQWFFLKMYERGLAYRKAAMVNWDPVDQTVLANEQVIDGRGDRSGALVERRLMEQWHLKITAYADELLDNLDTMDWPERVKTMQRNWIGRSEGAQVTFRTEANDPIEVFTTRPDTLWGATFMVLAPEHPLVEKLTTPAQREAVATYVKYASHQSEIERMAEGKEKTGVFTGGYAVNPVNGARIPVWIADYVLITYGTGAIMAVPAHDQRDFEFARKFDLPVVVVIQPEDEGAHGGAPLHGATMPQAYNGEGVMVNSDGFDGTPTTDGAAVKKVITWLEEKRLGKGHVQYRLRDWLLGRQRYWGTPIPMVYCDTCGIQPVRYDDLPVLLPIDAEFLPSGQSPLLYHEGFLNTTCPQCGGAARRETDTMDTFVDSSWYQYRYLSPHYEAGPFDPAEGDYWLPVDQYTGGIEHAILHLLYTRFWTKVMRDMGLVDFDEPMTRLYNQGIILGEDGEKMSKSRGNVIAPDTLVERYGADTVRLYLMFIGPWDQGGPWSSSGIEGVARFVNRLWGMILEPREMGAVDAAAERSLLRRLHQTIRDVSEDLEGFRFNTAVAELMKLNNDLLKAKEAGLYGTPVWNEAVQVFVLLLAPLAPHLAEELWGRLGQPYSVHQQAWPSYDSALAAEDVIEVPVQVNGKVRARVVVAADTDEVALRAAALATDAVQKALAGATPRKVIVVPGKLVNVVV
ncbi:MAG: leucine--tRNA ligase [Anaerolineae bacterium]|nr:leucine--tRNA ligase [Anaerolineae bacterium]